MSDILNFISAILTLIGIGLGVRILLGRHKIKIIKPDYMVNNENNAKKRRKK